MKRIFNKIYSAYKIQKDKYNLKRIKGPIKLVVGSGSIFEEGWIPTDINILNLLNPKQWSNYFSVASIDSILAEHVWEHLTEEDGIIAARTCYKYLKVDGYLRVAVPDGFHPNNDYINYVKPQGYGSGADDHKVLFNYQTFKRIFETAGFKINLYEYFDENGEFHFNEWKAEDGKIYRSKRFDERNIDALNYTSIILDAVK